MNVFLKFYDETKNIAIPPKFDEFKKVLAAILNMPPENVKGLSLYYNDAEGDRILIGVEDDYKEMYRQVANREVTMIYAEIKENESVIAQPQEKVSAQINPIAQQFYQNEMSSKHPQMNNNQLTNNKNGYINKGISQPVYYNIQQPGNYIYQNANTQGKINMPSNQPYLPPHNFLPNQPIMNNNQIINPQPIQPIKQIQPNQPIVQNSMQQKQIKFDIQCYCCKIYPILNTMYKCPICNHFFCANCEQKYGDRHPHSLLKIRNYTQLNELGSMVFSKIPSSVPSYSVQVAQPQPLASPYISNQPVQAIPAQEPSAFDTIVNTVKEIPSKVKTFFVGGEEELSKVQLARKNYNLAGFTDEQIEEALRRCNGNIDQAVIFLANK